MTTIQDRNPDQGVPAWLANRLGKLVQTRTYIEGDDIPAGRRGVLLSIATKARWGVRGVYCTVGFNLRDIGDETNVELSQLAPVDLESIKG